MRTKVFLRVFTVLFLLFLFSQHGSGNDILVPPPRNFDSIKDVDFDKMKRGLESIPANVVGSEIDLVLIERLWKNKAADFKTSGGFTYPKIEILFDSLKEVGSEIDGAYRNLELDNFVLQELKWCENWRGTGSTACDKVEITGNNFGSFKRHLIYSFFRKIIVDLQKEQESKSESENDSTKIENAGQSGNENPSSPETDNTIYYILGAFLLIGIIGYFLYARFLKKKEDVESEKEVSPPEKKEGTITGDTEVSFSSAQKNVINEMIDQALNSERAGTNSKINNLTSRVEDLEKKLAKGDRTPPPTPKFESSSSTPKKETYTHSIYLGQPNRDGVFTSSPMNKEDKKAFFEIRLEKASSEAGEFTLIDDFNKRRAVFNAPDTYLSGKISDRRFSGTIDYSSGVRITPGMVEKKGGKWTITIPMVIEK